MGQGQSIARKITSASFGAGTIVTAAILAATLRTAAVWASLAAVAIAAGSGLYYRRRIGGITGDCLGATNQVTEIAIYLIGVVLP